MLLIGVADAVFADADTFSAYMEIQDEGTAVTPRRRKANFIGAGVSCADNSGSARTDCTISAGSGDVTAVGDCLTGACFDGTDGGNLILVGTGPDIRWTPTGGDTWHLGAESGASGGVLFISNVTDSTHYLRFTGAGKIQTPGLLSCDTLDTTADGTLVCGVDGGGGGNSFETIAVPAGASVVADASTDTLTLTETSFLTITGTAATDTIDITQVTTDLGTDGLIAANAVALTTDTTGNYVSSATTSQGLLVTGTEGASVGLDDCAANQIWKRNAGDTAWECAADADSGGATAWSAIGDSAGDGAVAMAETVQTLDWNTAAVASLAITGLSLTYTNDAAADVLSQTLFRVANLAGANGVEVLQEIGNDDTDDVATTGLLFTSAAGAITTAIDASDAEIGTALLAGANPIAFGNVAGTIGDATTDSITLVTDGTGTGEVVLPNNSIGAAELASGALPPQTIWIPCVALIPIEAADSVPPLTKDAGTFIDQLLCTFDADTDEGRTGNFPVPSRIEAGSTVTFRVFWYSLAATTGDAVWNIRHNLGTAADVDPDVTLTVLTATDTTAGTASQVSQTSITETQTNLAWVSGDLVYFTLHRDANNAADTLAGDALVVGVSIQIPLL